MKTASISWTDTGYPAAIEFSPDALERLRQHTLAGLRSVSKLGVGGLLLGIRDTGTSVLRVEGLVEVPCAHDGGPSFSLTAEELTHALGLVRAPRGLSVLGWYVSRTQPPLAPRATDLNLYATLCPASWQIMVMIRPGAAETTKGVVIFRDPSGEIVSGAVRDIPEQGDASGLAAVPPMPGPDTQAAYRQAERADASAGRAASGATSKKRNQPEGAHGFEPVRSYQLMPEKQAVSGPAGEVKSTAPSAGAPRVVGKSVFQRNPFAVASTPKPVVSPADTRGGQGQSVSRPAGEANSKGSAPDAPGVARKSVFQQNPFAPPAGTRGAEGPDDFEAGPANKPIRTDKPVSGSAGDVKSPTPAPDAPGVGRKSVFQQNPFAPPAGTRGAEGSDDFEPVRANKPIRTDKPVSGATGEAASVLPAPDAPGMVGQADTRGVEGSHGFEAVRANELMPSKQAVPRPAGELERQVPARGAPGMVGKAETRGAEGSHGFEAVRANELMPSKQAVSRPAGETASAIPAPGGLVVPPVDTNQSWGPHGFEAFRSHNLIRGNQPAKAPDGDGERSASRPGARVVRSGPASESRAPAAPRSRRLVTGAVVVAAFSLVAWATSSLWLGAPLRLELTEAGGHITAIWNTDGVARGVAGSLVVTDSGKVVTIPLSPEKAITGVAGYNVKSGKISATLHIGDQEAKAEWSAPDNWVPPARPPGAEAGR